jgi:hypothetical protein
VQDLEECVHHWMLPPPNGKESLGICKFCDETRVHYNSTEVAKRPRRNSKTGAVVYTQDIAIFSGNSSYYWYSAGSGT